jgi:hypothetical protein
MILKGVYMNGTDWIGGWIDIVIEAGISAIVIGEL